MKLKQHGSNQTVLSLGDGKEVFFSYETPVAAFVNGSWYRTDCRWSRTTSKHINGYLNGIKAEEKPQAFFDALVA